MRMLRLLLVLASLFIAATASAAPYYVDWMIASISRGTASGTMRLADSSVITVGFQAITAVSGLLFAAALAAGEVRSRYVRKRSK
jgi:hypothetical protein